MYLYTLPRAIRQPCTFSECECTRLSRRSKGSIMPPTTIRLDYSVVLFSVILYTKLMRRWIRKTSWCVPVLATLCGHRPPQHREEVDWSRACLHPSFFCIAATASSLYFNYNTVHHSNYTWSYFNYYFLGFSDFNTIEDNHHDCTHRITCDGWIYGCYQRCWQESTPVAQQVPCTHE